VTKHRLLIRTLVAVLLFAVVAPAPATNAAPPDTVVQWNQNATDALLTSTTAALPGAGQSPPVATPHLAMVQGAVYDAVNAIDGHYQPYLGSPAALPSYSKDAAAATAAYEVLVDPSLRVPDLRKADLAAKHAASLAAVTDVAARNGGSAVGHAAASAMLAARADDGRFGSYRFPVPTNPTAGQWRPDLPGFVSDPNAWVARVTPFMVNSRDQFRSDGPNALASAEYAADFAEVKAVGSRAITTTRTAEQTDAARFWTENAIGMWSRIFRGLSAARGLTLVENARFFAMLYLTGADAAITCWADKAYWSFWRPITAIREAANDGNPATEADAAWLPLIDTPPYPDHSSGHSCLSGSIVYTLQDFFGTDKIGFSETSSVTGTTRSFARFSDAIKEIVLARVWSGLHFRDADTSGANIGKHVAHWRQKYYFQSMDSRKLK
jgi:hypothetical protein